MFPRTYRTMLGQDMGKDGIPGKYNHDAKIGLALFDLEADMGESTDLAPQYPNVVERLSRLADEARSDLGDELTGMRGTGLREPSRIRP